MCHQFLRMKKTTKQNKTHNNPTKPLFSPLKITEIFTHSSLNYLQEEGKAPNFLLV